MAHVDRGAISSAVGAIERRDVSSDGLALHRQLSADAKEDTPLGRALKRALGVMNDALRLYGPERVVTSFNGGKDAVVILQLMRAALAAHSEATGMSTRLRVIFFEVDDEFPEVDAFVRDTVQQYDLEMVSYADVGFAEGELPVPSFVLHDCH